MADNENNQHGSFNYEPTIGEVKSLKPFIFWTQTTLPTVFDDSLSYYEAMSKIAKMLNTLLENENTNAENIIELKKAYDKTKEYVNDYFANLDLTSEVNTKIEEMYADGRLTDIVVTKATQLVTNYLYGEDGESGVNKDINDMISEAQTDIEEALANFATRSNLAVTTFETNSAASIRTFEDRVDQELAGVSTIVEDWMDANFTNPSSVVIDDTLTTKDAAAEAYATGKLMDDATNMVLATSYWQDYVVDSVSGSFILADVSGGSNPAVGTGAPSKTLYIANVTPGETYIVSGVASSYSTTRYTPAYALGNLTYDASDNPYYEFYDVYPRGWDESQDPGTVYQYVRNQTVRIPTGTTPTVTHLFIVGDSRVPITVKCSRLNARTDTALTSETLPAQGKATGDALETKLPWPVSGGNKDLGTAGYGLVTNADGTTSWQEVGGDYDEEIENLQNDVLDLKSAIDEIKLEKVEAVGTKTLAESLLDTDAVTSGYYLSGSDGHPVANSNYCYTDYISVDNYDFEYTAISNGSAVYYYDVDQNLLTPPYGTIADAKTATNRPAGTRYIRVNIGISALPTATITKSEIVGYYIDMTQVVDGEIISVGSTRDYTTLKSAVDYVNRKNDGRKYIIRLDEGTYNPLDGYAWESLTNTFVGLSLPNNVYIEGNGNPDNIIIALDGANFPSNVSRNEISVLNFCRNNGLKNLTIKSKNVRYGLHDDDSYRVSNPAMYAVQKFENVHFINEASTTGDATSYCVGIGAKYGQTLKFKNCVFENKDTTYCAFLAHNGTTALIPAKYEFSECLFINNGTYSARFTTTTRVLTDFVYFSGCKFNKNILLDKVSSYASTQTAFKLYGHGNAGVTVAVNGIVLTEADTEMLIQ